MIRRVYALSITAALVGCGSIVPKAEDTAEDEAVSEETKKATEEANKKFSASSVADLNLTSVLSLQLPDSIKGKGTEASLTLVNRAKSFEACKLRGEIREALSNIAQAGATFCHLEKAKVGFGKKYNIKFDMAGASGGATGGPGGSGGATGPTGMTGAGGPTGEGAPTFPGPGLRLAESDSGMPDSIQVWIDDSKKVSDGKIRLYMCLDEKLQQMIELTGTGTNKSKGSMLMKGSVAMGDMFDMAFHRAALFDSGYTEEGLTSITVKERITFKSSQHGEEVARRLLSLSFPKTGASKVVSSFAGNQMGSDMTFASVGLFDTKFGSVIARGKAAQALPGSGPGAGQPNAGEFSNESFFDGKGNIVNPANHADVFGANGSVKLDSSDVPGYLPTDFKPEDLPADAWDCKGADEELEIDPSSGDHASCEEDWDELAEEQCFGGVFEAGEPFTVDETQVVNAEKFEGMPPPTPPTEPVPATN